jgi:tetratricopeptide (TPR) repeat protein
VQSSIEQSDGVQIQNHEYVSALTDLRISVESAVAAIKLESSNKHFDIPQQVSGIFTGREDYLRNLKHYFFPPSPLIGRDHQQKRFIIYGLAGSGKTQFCSKFAEDQRDNYWGVFLIDASSPESIARTCAYIASIGETEPNESAAMHWLSNLEKRWLLIVDNADDSKIALQRYFPKGRRGHVLVTTRNPEFKIHGNVGDRFFDFQRLRTDEATCLLLKAANHPTPWDSHSSSTATAISKTLGCLALAIVHAGAAIRNRLCSMKTYLGFYERMWLRIRAQRETDHDSVYTSFEISYSGITTKNTQASKDAIQLLKVFAFFHHENIRFDMFSKGVINCELEVEQYKKDRSKDVQNENMTGKGQTWSKWYRTKTFELLSYIFKDRGPPALPDALREAYRSAEFDEDRLRAALRELVQMSLIARNDLNDNDSYSMHPLVHKWARERPEMTLGEQAIWSEAAANILSRALLLPPLGGSSEEEKYRRVVLPHIEHVLTCQKSLKDRIVVNRKSRRWPWPNESGTLTRDRALTLAKFSIVYAFCGRWKDAEELQLAVREFTVKMLGVQHATTRRISLALAGLYMLQGRPDEAENLQRGVLNACVEERGPHHRETLLAKHTLAETIFASGRIVEALNFQKDVVSGMTKILGRQDEDTLTALNTLGSMYTQLWNNNSFDLAKEYHSEAFEGFKSVLGPDHSKTIIAKENLAVTSTFLLDDRDFMETASRMIDEVLEQRKIQSGKEHPLTLLAMVNSARIKCAMGDLAIADELLCTALPIGERDLGVDFTAVLWARGHLARVRLKQQRFDEAEEMLLDCIERYKGKFISRGNDHPDRIGPMIALFRCYTMQGRTEDAMRVCEELLEAFKRMKRLDHPIAEALQAEKINLANRAIDTPTSTILRCV